MNGAFTGVLLAAGESTRMGRPKPLLPWAGSTLAEWQCDQLRQGGCEAVLVVIGHQAPQVQAVLAGKGVILVENALYREGRASSLRAAAAYLKEHRDGLAPGGLALLNVDQPRPAWVTRKLIEAALKSSALVIQPSFGGHMSHPVLLAASLLDELLGVREETLGLRAVVSGHASESDTVALSIGPAPFDRDLNTPSEYEAALASLNSGEWSDSA